MRESLTVLAGVLILILGAALVGPYFVDWTAHRGFLEARLSEALGAPVHVGGAIDLKLLPTPYLALDDVEIADRAAPMRLSARALRLELGIGPLLRGEIDFVEADLDAPHLHLTLDSNRALRLPPRQDGRLGTNLRFDRVTLRGGTVTLDDATGTRALTFAHVDADAEAETLTGPFKGEGAWGDDDGRTAFRFSTSAAEENRLRLKLVIDETALHPRADIEGAVAFDIDRNRSLAPSFAGTLGLSGRWRMETAGGADRLFWRLNGVLSSDTHRAAIVNIDLKLGDEDRAMTIGGSAEIVFGAKPKVDANLNAKQLDLDRLFGGALSAQRLQAFATAFLAPPASTALAIPIAVGWRADSILLGGETLTGMSGAVALAQGQDAWLRVEGDGPGRAHLRLDGSLAAAPALAFNGHIGASIGDADRLGVWLRHLMPQSLNGLPELSGGIEFAADLSVSPLGFAARDLTIGLDHSRFNGMLVYTGETGPERARLFVDLNAPALDLDDLPKLQDAARLAMPIDLGLRLDARGVTSKGAARNVAESGRIHVKLDKTGDDVALEDFSIRDLEAATLSASGAWSKDGGTLDAQLDAAKPGDLARLLAKFVPGPAFPWIAARGAALAPARLDLHLHGRPADAAAPFFDLATVTGSAGATELAAKITAQATGSLSIEARLDAPEGASLLNQLGIAALPFKSGAAARLALDAQGAWGKEIATHVEGHLGDSTLAFDGSLSGPLAAPEAQGRVAVKSGDLTPILQAAAFAIADVTTRLPADVTADLTWNARRRALDNLKGMFASTPVSGAFEIGADKAVTGTIGFEQLALAQIFALALGPPQPVQAGAVWSNLGFATALVEPPAAQIMLEIKNLTLFGALSGEDARLRLEIAPGLVGLRDLTMKLAGGRAQADLTLRRDGVNAAIAGHVAATALGLNVPSLRGQLTAALDIAGSGTTQLALVGSLAGAGTVTIESAAIPHSDPNALARVLRATETDRFSFDPLEVGRMLTRELDQAPYQAPQANFEATLASGVLRLTPPADAPKMAQISAAFDLRDLSLDQRLILRLTALPKDWSGPPPQAGISFKGAPAQAKREIDATSFINAIAARTILRESARIQSEEFDIRERAFFNQRLLSERRRAQETQAVQKAKDDAQRAAELDQKRREDERRQAAEAARLERARRSDEEAARRKAGNAAAHAPAPIGLTPAARNPADARPAAPSPAVLDPSSAGRY